MPGRSCVAEIIKGIQLGHLTEAFGVGTAATIAHIAEIGYKDKLYTLSDPATRKFSNKVLKALNDIRYGVIPDKFGWNYIV